MCNQDSWLQISETVSGQVEKVICYKASGEHIELWEDLRTSIRKYIEIKI